MPGDSRSHSLGSQSLVVDVTMHSIETGLHSRELKVIILIFGTRVGLEHKMKVAGEPWPVLPKSVMSWLPSSLALANMTYQRDNGT